MNLYVALSDEQGKSYLDSTKDVSAGGPIWTASFPEMAKEIAAIQPSEGADQMPLIPDNELVLISMQVSAADAADFEATTFHQGYAVDFVHIPAGSIDCTLDDGTITLNGGDSIIFKGASHKWSNVGPEGMTMLAFQFRPVTA